MSAMLQSSFNVISEKPGGPAFSLPMHEAICVAIEKGDAQAAERAALVLIDQAEADLQDRLDSRKADPLPSRRVAAKRAHEGTARSA